MFIMGRAEKHAHPLPQDNLTPLLCRVWDLSLSCKMVLDGQHSKKVTCVDLCPELGVIVSASADHTIRWVPSF